MPGSTLQRRDLTALIALFFLVSGATSLVYEVVWMRQLTLVFGATQLATATVLGAFMGGLALGAWAGGRWMDRSPNLLVTYGILEVVIGLYALIFPHLMDGAGGVYRVFYRWAEPSFGLGSAFNGALMLLILMLPAACMGATLPALARFVTEQVDRAGHQVGRLYAINTTGAVLGTWAGGFVLLPWLGVSMTIAVTAAANMVLGAVAIGLGLRVEHGLAAPRPEPAPADGRTRHFAAVAAALGLSGLCAMVYEVAWSRFLTLVIGNSVYAFTLMLMAFLIGIAGGAALGAQVVRRWRVEPLPAAAACLVGTAATAFAVHHLFSVLPYWFVSLYALVRDQDSMVFVVQLGIACLVMMGPTLLMGAMFPVAVSTAVRDPGRLASDVGRLYTSNTVGGIVGSLLAGFVLIPRLGILLTLILTILAGLVGAVGLLIRWRAPVARRGLAIAGVFGLALLAWFVRPEWDPLLMSSGMYKYVSDLEEYSREGVRNYAVSDYELLYYKEGVTSTVTVAHATGDDNIWLANNGKIDASTTVDLPTQVLLGHFGFVFAEAPQRVLVVGLASGISAGSAALHEDPVVEVLEIEPAVVEGSHFFDHVNNRPLERANVRSYVNDARNHLFLADEPYDIVVNQPSNPWISGVSNLYTLEYFELCRERMTPDGVFVQWMQLYGMGREDLRCILKTLRHVFPHVILFSSIEEADIVMVASGEPLVFDLERIEGILATPEITADLARVGIHTPEDWLTYYLMDDIDIADLEGDGPLNTDDNMRIEFSAPRFLHYVTELDNFQLLLEGTSGPWRKTEPLFDDPTAKAAFYDRMGQAYFRRKQMDRAALAYLRAVKLAPGEPRYRISAELVLEALDTGEW